MAERVIVLNSKKTGAEYVELFNIDSETAHVLDRKDFIDTVFAKKWVLLNYKILADEIIERDKRYVEMFDKKSVYKKCEDSYKLVMHFVYSSDTSMIEYMANTFTIKKDLLNTTNVANMLSNGYIIYNGIDEVQKDRAVENAQRSVNLLGLDYMKIDDFGGITLDYGTEVDTLAIPHGVTSIDLGYIKKADALILPETCKELSRDYRYYNKREIEAKASNIIDVKAIDELNLGGVENIYGAFIGRDSKLVIKKLTCKNIRYISKELIQRIEIGETYAENLSNEALDRLNIMSKTVYHNGHRVKG